MINDAFKNLLLPNCMLIMFQDYFVFGYQTAPFYCSLCSNNTVKRITCPWKLGGGLNHINEGFFACLKANLFMKIFEYRHRAKGDAADFMQIIHF